MDRERRICPTAPGPSVLRWMVMELEKESFPASIGSPDGVWRNRAEVTNIGMKFFTPDGCLNSLASLYQLRSRRVHMGLLDPSCWSNSPARLKRTPALAFRVGSFARMRRSPES